MKTITVNTSPSAVTVFPDRARLTRTGRVHLESGSHRLEIHDLPLALIPDSIRASGKGSAPATLLGLTSRLENYLDTPADRARALEQQIQAQEDADANRAARAGVLEKERGYLEGLASQSEMFARGLALRNRTPEEQKAIFEFVSQRSEAIQNQLLGLARERRDIAKELDRLRRELRHVQSARPKQRHVVTLEVEAAGPGELTVELSYVVTGAAWQPLYDLRLSDSGLDLHYLAEVSQNTGEDWQNVSLALSTAQPALSLVLPELDPWYVWPSAPPRPLKMQRAMPAGAPMQAAPKVMAAGAAPEAAPEAPVDMAVDLATVSDSGASLTYRLAGGADIPGNNDPRKVTVASFPLKPSLDYVTAPKLADACYRRAKLKNDSHYSLLPGLAQLFEGDDYLGATRLEFTAPGQEFELVLGADERVRVERELAAREVDRTLIGDRRRIRYAYTIEVENLRDAPQTVTVRDQLPVSRSEQIRVKLEGADPKPAEQTDLNLLEWKLSLGAAAKQTVRFEFSVEYPRAMEVEGLP